MKVLYVAGRWDPRIQDEYSGNDYGAYHSIINQPDVQLVLVGPFNYPPEIYERIYFKIHGYFFKKRPIKYPISYLKKSASVIRAAIEKHQPDVIFSKYSAPFVYLDIKIPLVYMCDSTIEFARDLAQEFTPSAYRLMEKWEAKVIRMASRIITYSQANAEVIISKYGKSHDHVIVFPIPSQIPKDLIPEKETIRKTITDKINLLMIGKRYNLRGVDIAIEIAQQLKLQGIKAELRIVGIDGQDTDNVFFQGVFHKEKAGAIEAYFENFKWAHLLIHPSRFHSAGIVISEAAGFGVPTITNNVGGLATTVRDGITGVVLPANSIADAYVDKIKELMENRDLYNSMQIAARSRFDEELHWDVAGKRLFDCILSVLHP